MGLTQRMLDGSIFYSFDRSGYLRHRRGFVPSDLDRSMRDMTCLVTGANSGLGYAVAEGLAARDATVHMLCRSAERGEAARDAVSERTGNPDVHCDVVDVSSLASIRAFEAGFTPSKVDVLVHNAGLLPLERERTSDGLELTVATHLVGPFALTSLLRPKLTNARVIFVTSGGMYTRRLDLDTLLDDDGPYDGVVAYALTKRGQVILCELWARELSGTGTVVHAMHPGWAATKGVEHSLPRFWKLMRDRLRTPEEGADTALWLAVAERVAGETGKLWFDRKPVPTHFLPWTRESREQRQRLWDFCATFLDERETG